ncbi:MAG: hypothetical protein J5I94_13835 [Phaeodactylibacter sp.]|nr:hypothetical protein [Phaeodactylibacter sp.]
MNSSAIVFFLFFWASFLLLPGFSPQPAPSRIPSPEFRLLYTLPLEAKYFTLDKLRQAYLVTPSNEVVKYSPEGKELFRYNNNTRGELSYIDATDPFNLLLFYPELQAIATLDRTMNETALLFLFSADIISATAIALANDNNIWVYDQATFRLVKIAPDGAVLASSDNLSAQLARPPRAGQAVARENMVYLNDMEKGIFLFDGFAQYHQLIPLPGYEHMQMLDGNLQLFKKGELATYNLETLKKTELPAPKADKPVVQARWQGRRLYLLDEDGRLAVYEWNEGKE